MANSPSLSARLDKTLALGLGLTFLASLGTGAVTNGIFFLTESALGYGKAGNMLVALLMGVAYIAGAAGVGPMLRRRTARSKLTTREVASWLLVVIGAACTIPAVAGGGIKNPPPAWSLWVLVLVFGVLTGAFWPIVEGYISGGRRNARLRSAVGWFNIVWASSVIAAMWLIAPFVAERPMAVLLWVGLAHGLAALLLRPLPPEPPKHLDDSPHAVPPHFADLLRTTRVLLPAAYMLISAIGPAIPAVLGHLGVPLVWKAPVFSAWLVARLAAFIGLERWHGWHGRWWLPLVGGVGMIVGFACAVLSPRFGSLGLVTLFAGLGVFGICVVMIYVASLYYGMEVGGASVDDGGKHEAFIGLGYAGGPAFGLVAASIVGRDSPDLDLAIVAIVGPVALVAVVLGLVVALRSRRAVRGETIE
ncbi:MAG: hypothetical protein KIT88_04830 [Phycisphaeraceae bacterium]|nr:hypothetical protein [Phycisphaeraceae bacterium]